MALADYHPFPAWQQLQYEVGQLATGIVIAVGIKEECMRWHVTVLYKLKSADCYFKELEKYINIASASMGEGVVPDMFDLNRTLDAFLSCLFSAQDVLAKELNFIFGDPMAGNDHWNLTHLPGTFNASAPNRPTMGRVTGILQTALDRNAIPLPSLLDIRDYRNATIHAMLIPASEFTVSTGGAGAAATGKLSLPDTADSLACTGTKELGPTCKGWFCSQLRTFDEIYGSLIPEITAHRIIPLP